jgi:DNA-binding NarL/FixJ family response regulator
LRGESEKQIAQKLGLSRHTVHEYVGNIYRHFGVCSRAELMAMWVGLKRRER